MLWPLPSSLASSLYLVTSFLPLCRPVILNYSVLWLHHVLHPLSKTSFFKYLLPLHANVHSFVRSQPRCRFLSPTQPAVWMRCPFLSSWELPKHLYTLHLSTWFYCHLLVSILHKTINSQISRNVPVLFTTKYQATSSVQNIIDTQNIFDEWQQERICVSKAHRWINVWYKIFENPI